MCFAALLSLTTLSGVAAETESHPDFSGLWMPGGPGAKPAPNPLPFTEDAKQKYDAYVAKFTDDDDPGRYCIPPGMPRAIWGAPFAIEIFHRPQDLTIYFEGYSMYRKIYLEGHPRPEPVIPTQMGYSVGHWEGDTLVIETAHLKEYPYMNRTPNSDQAHILERLRMQVTETNGKTEKYLIDEITLTDPKVYTEPVTRVAIARWTPDAAVLEYSCSDLLWEEYLSRRGLELPHFD
jgi:hypothetical protein